jgi:hypothetical protein
MLGSLVPFQQFAHALKRAKPVPINSPRLKSLPKMPKVIKEQQLAKPAPKIVNGKTVSGYQVSQYERYAAFKKKKNRLQRINTRELVKNVFSKVPNRFHLADMQYLRSGQLTKQDALEAEATPIKSFTELGVLKSLQEALKARDIDYPNAVQVNTSFYELYSVWIL